MITCKDDEKIVFLQNLEIVTILELINDKAVR